MFVIGTETKNIKNPRIDNFKILYMFSFAASADGTPKKSPTSGAQAGFHHHVVMTDKSGALNVYVQVCSFELSCTEWQWII